MSRSTVYNSLGCSTLLPKVYLIDPWLLGEESKPIIICNADKALHFVSPGQLNDNFVKSVGLTLFLLTLLPK